MAMAAKGLAKLGEEIGELQIELGRLQQNIMKQIAFGQGAHPDGTDSLLHNFEKEAGDVKASIDFVLMRLDADVEVVEKRRAEKLKLFLGWEDQPDNNKNDMTGEQNG